MPKNKIVTEAHFDFYVMGIISKKKDHQLAWNLNQSGYFNFVKAPDLKLEFTGSQKMVISIFEDKSEFHCYSLLKNKPLTSNSSTNQFLLPEQSAFDYLLKLESSLDDFNQDNVLSQLREISIIDYLVKLKLEKLKLRENLLF